MAGCNSTHHSK